MLRLIAGHGRSDSEEGSAGKLDQPVAKALGVNVYGKQLAEADGRDRAQLEQERLDWRTDGRLQLTLKNVWGQSLPRPGPQRSAGARHHVLSRPVLER